LNEDDIDDIEQHVVDWMNQGTNPFRRRR
jgi:hypothetical protein